MEHLAELVEVTDPDHMTSPERRKARLVAEEAKFDPEHYMCAFLTDYFALLTRHRRGDFVMDEEIQELIHYVPRWVQEEQAIQRHVPREEAVPFTDDEKAALITLQNRNCTIFFPP